VLAGTPLVVIWTIADEERRFFAGATWDRMANAACSPRWRERSSGPSRRG
jgi:hypothetical protein